MGIQRHAQRCSEHPSLITFTKANAADETSIEAGTIIQTPEIEGKVYKLTVIKTTVIKAGQASGKVLCEASEAGAAYNLPAGYFSILPQGVSGIVSVTNEANWITQLGADQESDEELAYAYKTPLPVRVNGTSTMFTAP